MKTLKLELETARGIQPLAFTATAMINLGYVGRDEHAVRHHIEELAKEGVPPPATIPMIIPMPMSALSTDGTIDASGVKTSGEAEIVFLLQREKVYIGIGSDHTDRELERVNMALSKQVCPNVIGPRVWDFDDIKERWDALILQSFVIDESGRETLYQKAPLSTMLPPQKLMHCATSRLKSLSKDGTVIYSGTVGLLNSQFVYSPGFKCELVDAAASRRLTCEYRVRTLASMFTADERL